MERSNAMSAPDAEALASVGVGRQRQRRPKKNAQVVTVSLSNRYTSADLLLCSYGQQEGHHGTLQKAEIER